MKSFLIIGMGSLGHHLCREFSSAGFDVMVADENAEAVEDVLEDVVSAKVCDCTKIEVLRSFGIPDFEACFVCVGNYFQECLEITDLLHELGANRIYSSASREVEEKFLLRNGADRVIFPERDSAHRIVGSECSRNIYDCIQLSNEYAIYEIAPPKKWYGKTLCEIDLRNRHHLNMIAFKRDTQISPAFLGDYTFCAEEHLLVIGHADDVRKITG